MPQIPIVFLSAAIIQIIEMSRDKESPTQYSQLILIRKYLLIKNELIEKVTNTRATSSTNNNQIPGKNRSIHTMVFF